MILQSMFIRSYLKESPYSYATFHQITNPKRLFYSKSCSDFPIETFYIWDSNPPPAIFNKFMFPPKKSLQSTEEKTPTKKRQRTNFMQWY
uniref:Uncharacterized protein n=1 Tax=Rhizophora mucronata TaxID=61149 RepID=A0A2P2MX64_RHIMU